MEQTIAYYPFGGGIADLGLGHDRQQRKFGGKVLTTANGLNEYDFLARQYWPIVPMFTTLDPMCEKTPHLFPYLYCGNDPVNAIDKDGESTWFVSKENDLYQVIGGELNDDLNIYIYNDVGGNKYVNTGKTLGRIEERSGRTPLSLQKIREDGNVITNKES